MHVVKCKRFVLQAAARAQRAGPLRAPRAGWRAQGLRVPEDREGWLGSAGENGPIWGAVKATTCMHWYVYGCPRHFFPGRSGVAWGIGNGRRGGCSAVQQDLSTPLEGRGKG
jgi:hypothetical protein